MLELSHLMSRAGTNQWLSKNNGFFDTSAGCEPRPEDVAVSEDGDSADEEDESSAEEESEDEQSSAGEDHDEDHARRAICTEPADRRQLLRKRYRRHRGFRRPPPAESSA